MCSVPDPTCLTRMYVLDQLLVLIAIFPLSITTCPKPNGKAYLSIHVASLFGLSVVEFAGLDLIEMMHNQIDTFQAHLLLIPLIAHQT